MEKDNKKLKLNSVQLNIVAFVDVWKALNFRSLEDAVYMMDNSEHTGQVTAWLQTTCKPGQTLNWIIYPMASGRQADGSQAPSVRINNIVFLNKAGTDVSPGCICDDLKIYGGPDKIRSSNTQVYYYWAALVQPALSPGEYKYRLILELDDPHNQNPVFLTLDSLSLKVLPDPA